MPNFFEKHNKADYLKSAKCNVRLEWYHGTKSQYTTDLSKKNVSVDLGIISFTVDFSNSLPIAGYAGWAQQIYDAILQHIQGLPHIGIPESWRNEWGMEDSDPDHPKRASWIKCFLPTKDFHVNMLIGTYTFSDRVYVGDPKKALKV